MNKNSANIADNMKNAKMFGKAKVVVKGRRTKIKVHLKQTKLFGDKESIKQRMVKERFSLTCAPGGENHRGNQLIGRMPIKGEGFTASDIDGLGPYFEEKGHTGRTVILNLNELCGDNTIRNLADEHQGRVLLLRNWVQNEMEVGEEKEGYTEAIYRELTADTWDGKFLDPNKHPDLLDKNGNRVLDTTDPKGKRYLRDETKHGRVMNKLARKNICYAFGMEQQPDYEQGKGTIVDLKKKTRLFKAVERLKQMIATGLLAIGSKTKVVINVVEGNRYYDLKKTGIGFHGDTERVVVICITIGGGGDYPMRWQWFKDGMPVGKPIDIELSDGDVYIMSEKSVGAEWKKKVIYTLRHAAGAEKYRSLSRWEKRRPAYEAKLKEKEAKRQRKVAEMFAKQAAKDAAKVLKNKKLSSKQVKINDKKNKRKTTKGAKLLNNQNK